MPVHGALLSVHGVGVLLLGPSGIGKSECALELVARGHRLVADDVVELERISASTAASDTTSAPTSDRTPDSDSRTTLRGFAPERIRYYMEIRGLGIIYVPDLFGADAVLESAQVDLLCRLEKWREGGDYERLGLDRPTETVQGVEVPRFVLPARPGGSMATIVEVAAREHRQRAAGVSAADRLDQKLRSEMGR